MVYLPGLPGIVYHIHTRIQVKESVCYAAPPPVALRDLVRSCSSTTSAQELFTNQSFRSATFPARAQYYLQIMAHHKLPFHSRLIPMTKIRIGANLSSLCRE